jgi:Zn-dependent peptidase ImmA (M78 family)
MIWVKDRTGRFPKRPHYERDELDVECEQTVEHFLQGQHGSIKYPISTDDLTILLEQNVGNLDLYATDPELGEDVEGVTDFFSKRKPDVRINSRLTAESRYENRLRTTLTHELGHVKFHAFMYTDLVVTPSLFDPPDKRQSNQCKRSNMLPMTETDWMEWQAGFACGAYLMPITVLRRTVNEFTAESGVSSPTISADSNQGRSLIARVALDYGVSKDAARVRLIQRSLLAPGGMSEALF